MTRLELAGDVRVALSHLATYGLAAILVDAGWANVRLGWTSSLDARPVVEAGGCDPDAVAQAVRDHARRHCLITDWTARTFGDDGPGLLAPRIAPPPTDDDWRELARLRREAIDAELVGGHWLDLLMIGGLGEPAYWRFDAQRKRRPDEGASRWEMKTRNRGEDFVQHRLRKLAFTVGKRAAQSVLEGLLGQCVRDEVGKDAVDSRTGTGLSSPGPVDNALAWCALWGLSRLPVVARLQAVSETAGFGSGRRSDGRRQARFHLPVAERPLPLARLATILVSRELATAARADLAGVDELARSAARTWLAARGVRAIVRFPVWVSDNASAPERRALTGTVIPLSD